MTYFNPFRPFSDPALSIYHLICKQVDKRGGRAVQVWLQEEPLNVWAAVATFAKKNGYCEPTLAQVQQAECAARGHVDYCAQWAYEITKYLSRQSSSCGPSYLCKG